MCRRDVEQRIKLLYSYIFMCKGRVADSQAGRQAMNGAIERGRVVVGY